MISDILRAADPTEDVEDDNIRRNGLLPPPPAASDSGLDARTPVLEWLRVFLRTTSLALLALPAPGSLDCLAGNILRRAGGVTTRGMNDLSAPPAEVVVEVERDDSGVGVLRDNDGENLGMRLFFSLVACVWGDGSSYVDYKFTTALQETYHIQYYFFFKCCDLLLIRNIIS